MGLITVDGRVDGPKEFDDLANRKASRTISGKLGPSEPPRARVFPCESEWKTRQQPLEIDTAPWLGCSVVFGGNGHSTVRETMHFLTMITLEKLKNKQLPWLLALLNPHASRRGIARPSVQAQYSASAPSSPSKESAATSS